jgi:ABC-type multidrug transport system fused ATPase/permease subunit
MTRLILELVRPYRWIIAFILTAMLIQTAMSLAAPWPLKVILDNVVVAKHPLPHWMTGPLAKESRERNGSALMGFGRRPHELRCPRRSHQRFWATPAISESLRYVAVVL